jgi:hypothetical protein
MEWLRKDVIEAKRKQIECLAKGSRIEKTYQGCPASRPDLGRQLTPILGCADEETLNHGNIRVVDHFKPFGKLGWIDRYRRDSLALEARNASSSDRRTVV